MSNNDTLPSILNESVLTVLCFDDAGAKTLANILEPEIFDLVYHRNIAKEAIKYIETYGVAPKMHLNELLYDYIDGPDSHYLSILQDLVDHQDETTSEFVLDRVGDFCRQQTLKAGIMEAAELLKDGNMDEAEEVVTEAFKKRSLSFQKGTTFYDDNALDFTSDDEQDWINIGIPALDRIGICPAPEELYLIAAPPNRGKTWMLVHIGKMALQQRKKVLHITLEMSEKKTLQRYVHSMFSISKHKIDSLDLPSFSKCQQGTFLDADTYTVDNIRSLSDPSTTEYLNKELKGKVGDYENAPRRRRFPLIVKRFPTGALTLNELNAYLDELERTEGFLPDMIIIDYPDLMRLDSSNLRVSTGNLYKELRGVGVERRASMVVVSQTNKEGEYTKRSGLGNLAEDYSKAAIADNVLTYNQTEAEESLHLARLYVAKGRNEKAHQTILISQAYEIGQFCLDSALMSDDYWDYLEGSRDTETEEHRQGE